MMTRRSAILIIIFVGLLVYFNSLLNGFVWDDEEQVLNNVIVHNISNFPAFFMGSTFNTGGSGGLAGMYYKPMMSFFFSLLYTLFQDKAFFFHLFQVVIHITNAVLVFLLFKKILQKFSIALFLSLIFLVHPINVETAVYISALQDALYFFFGMIALLIATKPQLNLKNLIFINVLLLLSFLSKETGFLFVPIILAYRLFLIDKLNIIKLKGLLISFPVTIVIYCLLRFQIAGVYFHGTGPSPIMRATLTERLMSIPQILFYYFSNTVFPMDLAISQHWVIRNVSFQNFYLPIFLIITFCFLLGTILYKKISKVFFPILAFFILWLCIGLSLHLQLFPLDMTVADRWFYLPFVGLLGILGVLFSEIKIHNLQLKRLIIYFGVVVLIVLSVRTIIRNSNWRDGLSLYTHDIVISKNAFDLENNFGVELFRNGKIDEAATHFSKSTELAPYWWTNWNNLGVVTERRGDLPKASEYYQKSIDNGKYYLGYENQAKLLYKIDPVKARDFAQKSLQTLPNNSQLWIILSLSEYKLGNKQNALTAAKNAYILMPTQQTYYLYDRLSKNLPLEI